MKNINIFWLGLILIAVLFQTRFLFGPGLHTFSDEAHIANLHQMISGFEAGQLPPRWAPNMFFNYGHPMFNFYYPLPYYFGALINSLFGVSLIASLKWIFIAGTFLSGLFLYLLVRQFGSPLISLTSAIVYLYTPYRAVDLYVRGAIGEIWAFAFIPLTLLAFLKLMKKLDLKSIIFASFSLGGLILSHNVIGFLSIPFLIFFVISYLIFYSSANIQKQLKYLFLSIFLGLLITSFYWLPALVEKKYVQSGTPFNPFDHFPFVRQLVIPSWGYGASVWGPDDDMSFQIGVVNLLVVALSLVIMVTNFKKINKKKWFWLILFGPLGLFVFMMNIRSGFIWNSLPISDYIQFPWRFLLFTTLITSLMTATIKFLSKQLQTTLAVFIILSSVVFNINYFKPHQVRRVGDDYYLEKFLNNAVDYLPLTIWTKEKPDKAPEQKLELRFPGQIIKTIRDNPISYQVEYQSSENVDSYFNSFYFPGWEAKVDSQHLEARPDGPLGKIKLNLPKGEHKLTIAFVDTPIREWTEIISLVSFWLLLMFYILPLKKWIN